MSELLCDYAEHYESKCARVYICGAEITTY